MNPLTWKKILQFLQQLSEEQLNQKAIILNTDNWKLYQSFETIQMSELPQKLFIAFEESIDTDQQLLTIGS
jgi:hypothetical protein